MPLLNPPHIIASVDLMTDYDDVFDTIHLHYLSLCQLGLCENPRIPLVRQRTGIPPEPTPTIERRSARGQGRA